MTWNNHNELQEPAEEWGGSWTDKKLRAFSKYVKAYLTIMQRNPYWETIYFDGFAGSGTKIKSEEKQEIYQQLLISEEEERTYKGAAERILTLEEPYSFHYYYFIDKNERALAKLEQNLQGILSSTNRTAIFRPGDANEQLIRLSNALKETKKNNISQKYAALIFLDPFGMQINWSSIEALRGTRSDIWILVPTGVIVNRLLDSKGKLIFDKKLEAFFGLSKEEIKEKFYTSNTTNTLFGEEETTITKVSNPIEKIAKLYAERLRTIWTEVTLNPLRLENTRGVPIFHFVFASNNNSAVKIANQIIQNT